MKFPKIFTSYPFVFVKVLRYYFDKCHGTAGTRGNLNRDAETVTIKFKNVTSPESIL
jgi:hypothetical protein